MTTWPLLLCLASMLCSAQEVPSTEYRLKAAFLFNFLQFVDWPSTAFSSPEESVTICVLGPDPFGPDLDALIAGERINGRTIVIQRHQKVDPDAQCHLAFVNKRSERQLRECVEQLKGRPVLTVSDVPPFAGLGGMIEFVTQANRIRLRVNLRATSEAQLRLSSKLLKRSEIVEPAPA